MTEPHTLIAAADAILRFLRSAGRSRLGVTVEQMLAAGKLEGDLGAFPDECLCEAVAFLARLDVVRFVPWERSRAASTRLM